MVKPIIANNELFTGFKGNEISAILQFLHARQRNYVRGEMLQQIGHPFCYAGIVTKGQVEESCIIEDFNKIKLGQFFAGDLYGLAFASGQVTSPVQLIAQSDCEVIILDLMPLFNSSKQRPPFCFHLLSNLTKLLAKQDIHDTVRLHIANQKTIHDKLIVYLHHLPQTVGGYRVVPFSQTGLAAFLGVNRSALSRVISKMKANGELEVWDNKMRLLH